MNRRSDVAAVLCIAGPTLRRCFELPVKRARSFDRRSNVPGLMIGTDFERTYIRGRRRPGRSERHGSAIFPVERWNHFETASEGIARTTNSIEGWHDGIQALLQCHHPILWTFMKGLKKICRCRCR